MGERGLIYSKGDAVGKEAFTKWCKNEPGKSEEGGVMLHAYYNCWQQERMAQRHRGYFCQKPADGSPASGYVPSAPGEDDFEAPNCVVICRATNNNKFGL